MQKKVTRKSHIKLNEKFKVTCNRCGAELRFLRKEAKGSGRSWYRCPVCGTRSYRKEWEKEKK